MSAQAREGNLPAGQADRVERSPGAVFDVSLSVQQWEKLKATAEVGIRSMRHGLDIVCPRPPPDRSSSLKAICLVQEIYLRFYSTSATHGPAAFDFLWLLFVSARQTLLPQHDLPNSYALLLACVNALLSSTPPRAPCLRHSFSNLKHFPRRAMCGAADTLASLLATVPIPDRRFPATVAKLVLPLDAFLEEMLAPAGLVPCSAAEISSAVPAVERASSACRLYAGLVAGDGAICPAAAAALEAFYEAKVKDTIERTDVSPTAAPVKEPAAQRQASSEPENSNSGHKPAAGAAPSAEDAVAQALAWLEDGASAYYAGSNNGAGSVHGSGMEGGDASKDCLPEELARTAWEESGVTAPSAAWTLDAALRLTLGLYYKALGAVMASEKARLRGRGPEAEVSIDRVAQSQSFVKSLLACSMECVVAAHRLVSDPSFLDQRLFHGLPLLYRCSNAFSSEAVLKRAPPLHFCNCRRTLCRSRLHSPCWTSTPSPCSSSRLGSCTRCRTCLAISSATWCRWRSAS